MCLRGRSAFLRALTKQGHHQHEERWLVRSMRLSGIDGRNLSLGPSSGGEAGCPVRVSSVWILDLLFASSWSAEA